MRRISSSLIAALVGATLVALVSCSGSDSTTGPNGGHLITVGGNTGGVFDPALLQISVGDTVTWTAATTGHSVRSCAVLVDVPSCVPDGTFDSGPLVARQSFTYTYTQAGTFGFHCGTAGHCQAGESGIIDVR